MNYRKIRTKAVSGPAGIKCSCCRVGTLKQARISHNRAVRRRDKINVRLHIFDDNF